ncbi:PREDICTED: N-acetyl-D-glucosamine kinase [Polistes canadensis]|uniref:N-acetyl-D-glucosamine kinase n=1 Tax=Polistes canadensis TaxID=91411 RepID=UPI000718F5F3|nr:PREDICTED: N-acetyl-D-glucosamine kinase [Polistes canadensis]
MAGKKKSGRGGRKGRKQESKLIDEYQLRRDLRAGTEETEDSFDMEDKTLIEEKLSEKEAELINEISSEIRIGGIEGGGTHSTLIIINQKGEKLIEVKGPDTNHWILGMKETAARINSMIERGKELLNIPKTVPLDCVGLSLSGCEEETTNRLLTNILLEEYPDAAKDYCVSSDTLGSLRTGLEVGGVVLIAGTGSNALLINPDGKTHGCGGWGYMIGDEGSAYWIAYRACKYVFDDMDDLVKSPYPISYVWPAMRDFFKLTDRTSMLPHLYSNFDKSKFAMFAKEIANGCDREDSLCLSIFKETGRLLARHVVALSKKAHNDLKLSDGGLKVICVGSVWKSWKFMKEGFIDEIHSGLIIDELSLLNLTATSALGSSYLAAEQMNCPFVKPYNENVQVFFHYKRDHYGKIENIDDNNKSSRTMDTLRYVTCDKI